MTAAGDQYGATASRTSFESELARIGQKLSELESRQRAVSTPAPCSSRSMRRTSATIYRRSTTRGSPTISTGSASATSPSSNRRPCRPCRQAPHDIHPGGGLPARPRRGHHRDPAGRDGGRSLQHGRPDREPCSACRFSAPLPCAAGWRARRTASLCKAAPLLVLLVGLALPSIAFGFDQLDPSLRPEAGGTRFRAAPLPRSSTPMMENSDRAARMASNWAWPNATGLDADLLRPRRSAAFDGEAPIAAAELSAGRPSPWSEISPAIPRRGRRH